MAGVRTALGLWLARIGFAMGVTNQLTGFTLSISRQLDEGKTLFAAIAHYFGFLTILTNLAVILVYAAILFAPRTLSFFRRPGVQASTLATFILVMLFQHFILAPTRTAPLVGIDYTVDLINHYIAPGLFLVWWLTTLPQPLRWAGLPAIMLPAVLYPAYVLARGPVLNEYPYKVLDVNLHGYAFVLTYMVQVIIGFAVLCVLVLAVNALVRKTSSPPAKS